jgi:hypothetical protein
MTFAQFPAKGARRLRRADASAYLKEAWGLSYGPRTLAKLASVGGGPPMEYAGRIPLYPVDDGLDAWAVAKIEPRVSSTSERRARQPSPAPVSP